MHWSVGVMAFLGNCIITVKAFFFIKLIEQPFYNKIHVCAKSKKTV